MTAYLHHFFAAVPLAAIALALGYLCGKLRFGTFVLGPVAATLLVAIAIGQVGVEVSGQVKTFAFALFIYALGYMIGPQFVSGLGRGTLKQVHLTVVSTIVVIITVWALAKGFGLDKGSAAGVLAGGATESAVIGTATDALSASSLPKEEIARMTANIGVVYAITYLFGTFTVILFASSLTPRLLGIDLATASREYERELGGGKPQLVAGQVAALRNIDARVHQVSSGSAGRTVAELEREMDGVVIEQVVRGSSALAMEPTLALRVGDRVAVAGQRGQVIQRVNVVLGPESADSSGIDFSAEAREVMVTSDKIAGRTIGELRATMDPQARRGVFLTGITRLNQPLPIVPETKVAIGDVARIVGGRADLERVSKLIGYPVPPADKTDFLYFGLGLFSGFALGMLGVPFAGTVLGLGTGGGCLIAAWSSDGCGQGARRSDNCRLRLHSI
jgi:putative transport protein